MRVRPHFYNNEHAGIKHDRSLKKSASTESSGALNGIIKKLFGTDRRQTTDRQMKLRYNTHGCELMNENFKASKATCM